MAVGKAATITIEELTLSDFCFGLHHRDDITWLPYSTEDQLIKYFSKVDNVGTWDSHDYEVPF